MAEAGMDVAKEAGHISRLINLHGVPIDHEPMMKAVESKPAPCKKATYRLRKDPTRPRRPYSVYNIFFANERKKMMEEKQMRDEPRQGETKASRKRCTVGVGFGNLARIMAERWKSIDKGYKEELQRQSNLDHIRQQALLDEQVVCKAEGTRSKAGKATFHRFWRRNADCSWPSKQRRNHVDGKASNP
jgi:hypothetical protein